MSDTFYQALEDQHRGSRELIQSRLAVYWPWVHTLHSSHPQMHVLDLGCGRGEWLQLLAHHGVTAHGIDTSPAMVQACQQHGLSASQAEAIAYLQAQPSHSLHAISAFHLIEHLPFSTLHTLLEQARRVLVPGGLLLLETPNPENLCVAGNHFYIDPTHQRPLPQQLMHTLLAYHGYQGIQTLRLQEEPRLRQGPVSLHDVLSGASPDYGLAACTPGGPAHLWPQPAAGLQLHELAQRYDQARHQQQHDLQHALAQLGQQISQTQHQAAQAQQQAAQAEKQAAQARQQATQAEQQAAQALLQTAQTGQQAQQLAEQLAAVYQSRSWRITAPLRRIARQLQRITRKP